ncbi:hypothetical protein [Nostoc sp.]|uniref:hypothetical protein n=1 Tax=Nostoc sp. TaxID=1180 RepID=UPI002FF48362
MNREAGKVKWYGGLNSKTGRLNDYGFISHLINTEDLYFNKRDIKCSENYLKQDAIVSFYVKAVKNKNGKISSQCFDIDLIQNEEDLDVIKTCALSNQVIFWQPIFSKYLQTCMNNQSQSVEDLAALCIKKSNLLSTYQKNSFIQSLPQELYLVSKDIRKLLQPQQAIKIFSQIIEKTESKDIVDEIFEYINNHDNLVTELPQQLLKIPKIYDIAPKKLQAKYIISASNNNLSKSQLNKLVDILKTANTAELEYIVSILPSELQAQPIIFDFLLPTVQVDIIWDKFKSDTVSIWEKLSKEAKVFSLYRAVQENLDLNILTKKADDNDISLVSFCLKLFAYPKISFLKLHESLLKLIVAVNGDTSQLFPLFRNEDSMLMLFDDISLDDLTMLLGDIFSGKGDLTSCVEKESSTNKCYKWSLRHFLVAKSIQIQFPRITLDVDEYIRKIKAWANFVQNNSQRLKCRFCGELMTFNPEYSKYSTTQEITVFWCPNADPIECSGISGLDGRNHNYNVYINHCWNCPKTVDSRNSLQHYGINYKSDGWVKCTNCRAGKKPGY